MKNATLAMGLLTLLSGCGDSQAEISQEDLGAGGSSGAATDGTGGEGTLFGTGGAEGAPDGGMVEPGEPGQQACLTETAEAKPSPVDIALLVDTSYSMDFELRWQYVKGALLTFVSAARGDLGLSLQFFPQRAQCDVDAYSAPAVPMALVGESGAGVEQALAERRMSGGTPIVQALAGVGSYVTDWQTAHPDRRAVIVLATDGVPDDTCSASSLAVPNDLENATETARSLATGDPAIPVFVIGVGEELEALHSIAEAGGTDQAILVADGAAAQSAFLDALEAIQRDSIACDYSIPAPSSGVIDYERVNVRYSEGDAAPSDFFYVTSADACSLSPSEGWYYDDPVNPTRVVLCPETCDRATGTSEARIDIAYGCDRNDVIR